MKVNSSPRSVPGIIILGCMLGGASYAAPVFVTSAAALSPNDQASWNQLGPDQTTLNSTYTATSVGGKSISGSFTSSGSIVQVVCPASPSCSWIASGSGFADGDFLIVTSDGFGGVTGPLSLSFPAELGAGLEIQSDIPGTYTAQIVAFDGASQIGSFTESSDSSGDPLFIGVLDTTPDITKITVNLSACGGLGCNVNDFAVDTLDLRSQTTTITPEPSALLLLGVGLATLLAYRSKPGVRSVMTSDSPSIGKEHSYED